MAYGSTNTGIVAAANFIPELWSDETAATFKGKTVMANLVKQISFKGKRGDTMHIPVPARGDASAKALNTAVNPIADTAGVINLVINKHYEYSKLYEDIAEVQALNSMRSFYTDDAGYALAKVVDRQLHLLGATLNAGALSGTGTTTYEKAVIGGDGSTNFSGATPGNGTALTDAGIRRMIQTLEDQDADPSSFVIPPVEARVLRGISRFTEQAFVGSGDAIKTGRLGNLYGVEVFVSSQCPWLQVDSGTSTQAVKWSSTAHTTGVDEIGETVTVSGTMTNYRVGLMLGRDALVLGMQQGIRTQSQYKQEYLGTLVTSDTIFGVAELRDYAALAVVVPA